MGWSVKIKSEITISDFFCYTTGVICSIIICISIRNLSEIHTQRNLLINKLNNTERSVQNILVFNRVPKAGSTSLNSLIREMSTKNNFNFYQFRIPDGGMDSEIQTMPETDRLTNTMYLSNITDEHAAFFKHMHFFDFGEFNHTNPIYLNIVRHPVDRVLSWFYYIRSTAYILDSPSSMKLTRLKGFTISDCIEGKIECGLKYGQNAVLNTLERLNKKNKQSIFSKRLEISKFLAYPGNYSEDRFSEQKDEVSSQMRYFCGYTKECHDVLGGATKHATFQLAKENVDKYYSVVAVLEDMHTSAKVMEAFIPRFFSGLSKIIGARDNTNKFKPDLTEEARLILEENLDYEIMFYEHCKQRLYKQYRAISL